MARLKSPCEMRVTLGSESSAGMWLCSQAIRAIISGMGSPRSCDLYCCAQRRTCEEFESCLARKAIVSHVHLAPYSILYAGPSVGDWTPF